MARWLPTRLWPGRQTSTLAATMFASALLAQLDVSTSSLPALRTGGNWRGGVPGTLRLALRGGGKNREHKSHREHRERKEQKQPAQGSPHTVRAKGREDGSQTQNFKAQVEAPGTTREDLASDGADVEEERFSYLRVAEEEMRRVEEKAAAREHEYQQLQEKRRRGEIEPDHAEVVDTLRWPSAEDGLAGKRNSRVGRDEPCEGEQEDDAALDNTAHKPELSVKEWLEEHQLGQYADTFETEGWDDLEAIHTMSEQDMLDIGVKRGHVRRMMLAMGREPRAMLAESMPRRGMSMSRSRGSSWAFDAPEDDWLPQRDNWRDQADREHGLRANVGVNQGPGGASRSVAHDFCACAHPCL